MAIAPKFPARSRVRIEGVQNAFPLIVSHHIQHEGELLAVCYADSASHPYLRVDVAEAALVPAEPDQESPGATGPTVPVSSIF